MVEDTKIKEVSIIGDIATAMAVWAFASSVEEIWIEPFWNGVEERLLESGNDREQVVELMDGFKESVKNIRKGLQCLKT